MSYLYENTDPERFQEFCQSLLLEEFPNMQCLPVGQPDGGRDGWDSDSATVLQVKFKRNDEPESADWIIATLKDELPKIRRLVENGAKRYVLATNASGTAHPKSGRIDRVDAWLRENVDIPAICLWRADLDRRLDKAPAALKFKYSELLSLQDGVELVFASQFDHTRQRQLQTIRWFVSNQYKKDRTVKFKQVNLSNDLLDLFVDIPVNVGGPLSEQYPSRKQSNTINSDVRNLMRTAAMLKELGIRDYTRSGGRLIRPSAAELLLKLSSTDNVNYLLVEGAPGQGKSTLAQYVCQVHRAKLLGDTAMLARIPDSHQRIAFRVPVKVDLRDFASFLEGRSPFSESGDKSPSIRSLENFLAELISHGAGGVGLDAYDVLTILNNNPVLLFLDGLDEVADIGLRDRLVGSIGETLDRLQTSHADIQVIMTSRPSVFGRSAAVEQTGFLSVVLQNLERHRIDEYTNKWVKARQLDEVEADEVKRILEEKLEHAHIQELTRNPMQLTILLSLIHQVGHSLPDRRTDLYHKYIDLFLTREADKSTVVRNNRTTLVNFIAYLAWLLQSQAESSHSAGSISLNQLVELARDYLKAGSHDDSLADTLFGGGLERVFVLVARIEGLYEFEVQPLREYFCAYHLYQTAPIGSYRFSMPSGDRSQRFEAIAANPFWLNVTRFYAGFYAMGEVGNLVMSLKEMIASRRIALSVHARRVGIYLIQDRIFSDKKFQQEELIRAIFDDIGMALIFGLLRSPGDRVQLQPECGRDSLREILLEHLRSSPNPGYSQHCCIYLRTHGGADLRPVFERELAGLHGIDRSRWLVRMFQSGAARGLNAHATWKLLTEDSPSRIQLLERIAVLGTYQSELLIDSSRLLKYFVEGVLDGVAPELDLGSFIDSPGLAVFSATVGNPLRNDDYREIRRVEAMLFAKDVLGHEGFVSRPGIHGRLVEFAKQVVSNSDLDERQYRRRNRRTPRMDEVVAEAGRSAFGERWAWMALAVRAAGIGTSVKVPAGSENLFDVTISVYARARYARLKRGGSDWWLAQLTLSSGRLDEMFWACLVLLWTKADNLVKLGRELDSIIDSLSVIEFRAVRNAILSSVAFNEAKSQRIELERIDLSLFSKRTAFLVLIARESDFPMACIPQISNYCEGVEFNEWIGWRKLYYALATLPRWQDDLAVNQWLLNVVAIRNFPYPIPNSVFDFNRNGRLSVEMAERMIRHAREYPGDFLSLSIVTIDRSYRPDSLTKVSNRERWTFE